MKKLHLLLLCLTICLFTACHDKLWDAIDDLDVRVARLEELCKEMNTNITSIQTIVNVFQSNDVITSIVEIKKDGEVIGYTITFAGHAPITIYHGKNGADGKDGSTPVIGVAQDTNGVYYWTLNGEWLLDNNGNKIAVSDITQADGSNGKDGITPQLKIEDGYWYVSYDNGTTWTQLGKATGEDGQNGDKGDKGDTGDSMFQSVTQDANYVYFTLADGTVIKIAKGNNSNDQPNSEFIFTITYDPNRGEGVMKIDTFYYGKANTIGSCTFTKENHYCKNWNTSPTGKGITYNFGEELTIDKNITLYAQWYVNSGKDNGHDWVDLGLSVKWATMNIGAVTLEDRGMYFAWGEVEQKDYYDWSSYIYCNGSENTITKYCSDSYWGIVDNKIILEPLDDAATKQWEGNWRMPTVEEMTELLTKCTWQGNKIIGKNGNSIILPLAGSYVNGNLLHNTGHGTYWSSTGADYRAYLLTINGSTSVRIDSSLRCTGYPIRPVCP